MDKHQCVQNQRRLAPCANFCLTSLPQLQPLPAVQHSFAEWQHPLALRMCCRGDKRKNVIRELVMLLNSSKLLLYGMKNIALSLQETNSMLIKGAEAAMCICARMYVCPYVRI